MLTIRLTRMGAKKRPFYRIVVTESSSKRDGRFVEIVGHFDPISTPTKIVVKRERFDYWVGKGAQPSPTVLRCLKQLGKTEAVAATA